MKKCLIYIRTSTDAQEKSSDSQLRELLKIAKEKEWDVVGRFEDIGISGMTEGRLRKGFSRVIDKAIKKEFDILLVWGIDRITREGAYAILSYLRMMESCGISVVSASEPYLENLGPMRDGVIALIAAMAGGEVNKISEAVKRGLRNARANGVKLGRPGVSGSNIKKVSLMRSRGMSIRSIAKKTGLSVGLVFRIVTNN